jgi:hypothetical protein
MKQLEAIGPRTPDAWQFFERRYNPPMIILFLHGWTSIPGGIKSPFSLTAATRHHPQRMARPARHPKLQRNSVMKIASMLTLVSAGLLLAADNPPGDTSKKIRELHKEYVAALQQAADLLAVEYKNERRSYDELFQGRLLLLKAKLEASETGAERVKFQENIVEMMKEREASLVDALKFEKVDALKVLNAKAERIKAEIALEVAKGNSVKPLK